MADIRQEAQDRFDRLMRVPDRIVEIAAIIGVGVPLLFMMDSLFGGPGITNENIVFYLSIKLGVVAVYVLYAATRFTAACVIAAVAVRRQRRANSRGAGRQVDTPAVQVQTVRLIVAGR